MPKLPIPQSLRPKVKVAGMSWFHEADYAAALAIMTDTELPPTYAVFRERAEKREREVTREGYLVIRAVIDPKTFLAWCAIRGRTRIDADARRQFAAEFAADHIGL